MVTFVSFSNICVLLMKEEYQKTIMLMVMCLISIWMGIAIFTNGMFFDGIVYAAVANNLAHDVGSLWHFQYSPTFNPNYIEQPPLMILIQSWFFRVLGDGVIVERIYCVLFAGLMVYIIRALWKEFQPEHASAFWFPVLLWIIVPIIPWTYQNNLQEVTMAAFDGLAVLGILFGCRREKWFWLLIGGAMIFLASFTKGIQGLFPLAIPFLYWLILRKGTVGEMLIKSLMVISVPLVLYSLLFLSPDARLFYQQYFERRLAGSFAGIQNTTSSHFHLLYQLLEDLIIPIGLCSLMWLWLRLKKEKRLFYDQEALLFISIGLSASLPLMVTLEQRKFYLATSIPYFAMGLAVWTRFIPLGLASKIEILGWNLKRIRQITIIILFCLPFGLPFLINISKRERDLITDLQLLKSHIPERSILSIPASMATQWSYHAYFMRYNHLALDEKNQHAYYLSEQPADIPPDSCYQEVEWSLKKFRLYHCPEKE